MKKGGSRAASGFTIVETLIVLAVTSALLIIAITFINGKQDKTQFMVAINGLKQNIQQLINETASGYYPNNGDIKCGASANGPVITSGAADLGTNGDCIFLGNAIRFSSSLDAVASGTRATEQYTVFPLVGLRLDSGNKEVQSLDDAKLKAIAPGTGSNSGVPNYSRVISTQNGLVYAGKPTTNAAYGMRVCSTTSSCTYNTTVIAIVSSLGSYSDNGNSDSLQSGSQHFSLYQLPQVHTFASDAQTADQIDCSSAGCPDFTPIHSAEICYASGGTNQSGLLTIGNTQSGGLSVDLQIYGGRQCGFPSS